MVVIIPKLFRKQSSFYLKLEGHSMEPLLFPGDIVYFEKKPFSSIRINDIILAVKKKSVFVHRVIYKTSMFVVTKGENNRESDGKILAKNVIARVSSVKRDKRTINLEMLYLIQSSNYFSELVQLNKSCVERNIEIVFLKGLPLHLFYEHTIPRRLYADCDILVSKKDYGAMLLICSSLGYHKVDKEVSPLLTFLRGEPSQSTFTKLVNGFSVFLDIHTEPNLAIPRLGSVSQIYPVNRITSFTNDLFVNKKNISLQSQQFPIISGQYLIVYLALHFFIHRFRGAYRLEFFDTVLRKELAKRKGNVQKKEFWETIRNLIYDYHMKGFLYPSFWFLKKYFNSPVPAWFLTSLEPKNYKKRYCEKYIYTIDVFSEQTRERAARDRFIQFFMLSDQPVVKKVFVFFNLRVMVGIMWVVKTKLAVTVRKMIGRLIVRFLS